MTINYTPRGVCSRNISFELENGIICGGFIREMIDIYRKTNYRDEERIFMKDR